MATDPSGQISIDARIALRGLAWKYPCRVATTGNVTIATALNAGDTIDGVTLAAGDRVLVKSQSTGSQNGIYIAGATPIRAWDQDQDQTTAVPAEEVLGSFVYVIAGTASGGKLFYSTNTTIPTVLGTTTITYAEFAPGATGSIIASHGSMGATETFTFDPIGDGTIGPVHEGTLNASLTATFAGAVSGEAAILLIKLTQDGTGGWTVTWPGSVAWPGGVAPTLITTAGAVENLTFISYDGGTIWYGFHDSKFVDWAEAADIANVGAAASAGVSSETPRADHVHALTGATVSGLGFVGEILIADVHSTPLVFDDLLQNDDMDNLLYADVG